jgi:hypothetical protein
MDIHQAIKCSQLGKLQKRIDSCNNKNGCDTYCSKAAQATCKKLIDHANEMANLNYDK